MNNIRRVKITSSILILGSSLIFSFLMIFNSLPAVNDSKKSAKENFIDPLANNQSPIQWAGNEVAANNANLAQNNANNNDEENNFTKNLMETVANRVQAGSFGKQGFNQTFPSDKEINKKFQIDFIEFLRDSEIKISDDNSKEAKLKYLEILGIAGNKNYGNFKKNPLEIVFEIYENSNLQLAIEAAEIYKNTAKDFSNIPVPSDWKKFHKNLILYFKNGAIIYKTLAAPYEDPIKSYAAIDKAQEMIIQKGLEINKAWLENFKKIQ